MTAHDAQHRGEPQAAPGELGGEEGIEDPRTRLLVHAAALVDDLEVDAGPRGQLLAKVRQPRCCRGGRTRAAGPDRDLSAGLAARLGGVGDQVHHHLAQLGGVRLDAGQVVGEVVDQHRPSPHRSLQQLRHLADEPGEVERLDQ